MDANSQRLRQEPDKNRQAKYRPMQVSLKSSAYFVTLPGIIDQAIVVIRLVIVPILPARGQPSASPRIRLEAH